MVPPGDLEVETRLVSVPSHPEYPDGEQAALPWKESVPPPGADGTLLAVVPIPGTGTSLAIVGYAITTSGGQQYGRPRPARKRAARKGATGLRLDHTQRRVWADGHEIVLTYQEFELLAFLSAHPATVFSRADLLERVWHRDVRGDRDQRLVTADSRTVDVHISRLRHKLGSHHGQCLVTEYRVGYQFRPPAP